MEQNSGHAPHGSHGSPWIPMDPLTGQASRNCSSTASLGVPREGLGSRLRENPPKRVVQKAPGPRRGPGMLG